MRLHYLRTNPTDENIISVVQKLKYISSVLMVGLRATHTNCIAAPLYRSKTFYMLAVSYELKHDDAKDFITNTLFTHMTNTKSLSCLGCDCNTY